MEPRSSRSESWRWPPPAVVVESEILVHAVEGVTAESRALPGVPRPDHHSHHRERGRARHRDRWWRGRGRPTWRSRSPSGRAPRSRSWSRRSWCSPGVLIGQPMNLVFSTFEVVTLAVSTIVVAMITLDGESHWFEGVQLLALYAMVAAAAYFL